jgi:hypothetical protein
MDFVTSFSPDLYSGSGRALLASFRSSGQEGRLMVCHEAQTAWDPADDSSVACGRFLAVDLAKDDFLQEWLHLHRRIIPDYLGGQAQECSCKGREERHAKHKHGCHWQWMNRNASRFFRKVAAFRLAAKQATQRYLVWLDSDCVIHKPLTDERLAAELRGDGFLYCRGHRPAVESGVLVFDLEQGGNQVIKALMRRYVSAFRSDERWDDGFQIARLIDLKLVRQTRDLVHPTKYRGKTNNVIPTTWLAEFVTHRKGTHGTGLGLML